MARDLRVFKALAPRMMRDLMRDFAPLADFQAAGGVGNGGGESGGFTIAQEGGIQPPRGGWGGFQWTGPRRRNYEAFITAHGGDPTSPRDALNYDMMYGMLKQELQGPEKATILALRQTRDVAEATKMFMVKFERPGVPHYEGRVSWSKIALDAYHAEEGNIAKNPDIEVAQEPAKLPVPPAIPNTKEDVKHATGTVGAAGGFMAAAYAFLTNDAVIACIVVAVLAVVWWFLIRPIVLRFTALGDIEASFLTKLRVAVKGIKTKLFAALLTITGVALPLIQTATGSNLLDSLPTIKGIPASVYGFGLLALVGWATNALRNATTTAVGQTDLAIVPVTPTVPEPEPEKIDTAPSPVWTEGRLSQTKKKKPKKAKRLAAHHALVN